MRHAEKTSVVVHPRLPNSQSASSSGSSRGFASADGVMIASMTAVAVPADAPVGTPASLLDARVPPTAIAADHAMVLTATISQRNRVATPAARARGSTSSAAVASTAPSAMEKLLLRELPVAHQLGEQRLSGAGEHLVDQPTDAVRTRGRARDGRDVSVGLPFLGMADVALRLEGAEDREDRRIRQLVFEPVAHLGDGAGAEPPEDAHEVEFTIGEVRHQGLSY
jgi:hypothetical protein